MRRQDRPRGVPVAVRPALPSSEFEYGDLVVLRSDNTNRAVLVSGSPIVLP